MLGQRQGARCRVSGARHGVGRRPARASCAPLRYHAQTLTTRVRALEHEATSFWAVSRGEPLLIAVYLSL